MKRVFNRTLLLQCRTRRGWSTVELAKKAGFGNSETVRAMESGETTPRMETVVKLCAVFPECKPEDFFNNESIVPIHRLEPPPAEVPQNSPALRSDEPGNRSVATLAAEMLRDEKHLETIRQHSEDMREHSGSVTTMLERLLVHREQICDKLLILEAITQVGKILEANPNLPPILQTEIANLLRQVGNTTTANQSLSARSESETTS